MLQPQLKDYVYFARLEQGVYFRGMGQQFVIKNAALYPLICDILQQMDGQKTVAQMTELLTEPQQKLLPQLLRQLAQHQMLRDGAVLSQAAICPEASWAPLLRYLADRSNDAPARFAGWQQLHVGISGDSAGVMTAIKALARQGVGRITVHLSADCDAQLAQETALLVTDLTGQHTCCNLALLQSDQLPQAEVTILLLQHPTATRLSDLQQANYVSANLADKNFVLHNSPQLRWQQLVEACNYQPDPDTRPSRIQQQTSAAVLVQQLIDDWFGVNQQSQLLPCIDLSGAVSRHALQWTQAPATSLQQLRAYLLDPCFGPFREVGQEQLSQIPFQLAQLQLRKSPDLVVTGFGNNITEAEDHALQQALQWLVTTPTEQVAGLDPIVTGQPQKARQWLLQTGQQWQAYPVIFDRIDDRELHQLLSMWRIYHRQMLQVQHIPLPDALLALRAYSDADGCYLYAFGQHKNAVLRDLLAQFLVPLQLGKQQNAPGPGAAINPDLSVTAIPVDWSDLTTTDVQDNGCDTTYAIPATGKLAGTGVWLSIAGVQTQREVFHAA